MSSNAVGEPPSKAQKNSNGVRAPSVSHLYDIDSLRRALEADRAKYGSSTQHIQGGNVPQDLSDPPASDISPQLHEAGPQGLLDGRPQEAPRVVRWDDDYDVTMDVDEEEDYVGMNFISDKEVSIIIRSYFSQFRAP